VQIGLGPYARARACWRFDGYGTAPTPARRDQQDATSGRTDAVVRGDMDTAFWWRNVPLAATFGRVGKISIERRVRATSPLPAGETLCRLAAVCDLIRDEERDAWLESLRGPSSW
jgi:hypothetical protein